MRALLIHNPTAGVRHFVKEDLIEALRLAHFDVDYVSTKGPTNNLFEHARELVVAAGGDGTISYVLTRLPNRSVPIAILPLGSANNIARSLGITGTPRKLVERWRMDHLISFNLMMVHGLTQQYSCTEGFGVGLIPAMLKKRAKQEKLDGAEDLRRGRQVLRGMLGNAQRLDVEIAADGEALKADLIGVEVLTCRFTGPALPLARVADPSDRLLEIIGIECSKTDAFTAWIGNPQHRPAPVLATRAREVRIRWRDAEARLDDKVVEARRGWQRVTISCDSEPLRVVAPG